MIELRGLQVHFPLPRTFSEWARREKVRLVRAVDGVDLDLAKGEIVALVGESGSGKTTTGRALVRLAPISGGKVFLEGTDVTAIDGKALQQYRRRVQIIFQDPYESLDPRRTVQEAVSEPLIVQGVGDSKDRRDRVVRALEDAGLRPASLYLRRYPHELSGGQRQRVAIACAMVLDPDVLVADEPVSMLDVSLRSGILRVMLALREKRGVGILFITHDLSLAWLIADRIAVMYLGRIVEVGPAEEIVRDPRHPYTRALLSVMPSPDPARRRKRQILVGETPDASRIPKGCRFHTRCPLAFDRCREDDPPYIQIREGHQAACFLADQPAALAREPIDAPRSVPTQDGEASSPEVAGATHVPPSPSELAGPASAPRSPSELAGPASAPPSPSELAGPASAPPSPSELAGPASAPPSPGELAGPDPAARASGPLDAAGGPEQAA